MSQKITVKLPHHRYDIHAGSGLLDRAGDFIGPLLFRPQTVIVTDENVATHQLTRLQTALDQAGIAHDSLILPAGENSKSFAQLEKLLDALLARQLERTDCIIALGGGVIGDLVGFAASIYQRGIDFIQIPTSLLAQVDSAVGGKTAINSPRGKNLIGSFHQPLLVLSDVTTLDSLPPRQLVAGYAEVVKYGLMKDPAFFDWLDQNADRIIAGDREAQTRAILTSCQAKADIVAADEKEKNVRVLLNLGHTFGHALEAECGYNGRLLHGEAVAIGMTMAFDLSVRMGLCPAADATRVRKHLKRLSLPTDPKACFPTESDNARLARRLFDHSLQDKKAQGGKVVFVLTRGIGQAFLSQDVKTADVISVFQDALETR